MSKKSENSHLEQRLSDDANSIQIQTGEDFTAGVKQRLQPRDGLKHPSSWHLPTGLIATAAAVAMAFFLASPLDQNAPSPNTEPALAADTTPTESPVNVVQESDDYLAKQETEMQTEMAKINRDWTRMKAQWAVL